MNRRSVLVEHSFLLRPHTPTILNSIFGSLSYIRSSFFIYVDGDEEIEEKKEIKAVLPKVWLL